MHVFRWDAWTALTCIGMALMVAALFNPGWLGFGLGMGAVAVFVLGVALIGRSPNRKCRLPILGGPHSVEVECR